MLTKDEWTEQIRPLVEQYYQLPQVPVDCLCPGQIAAKGGEAFEVLRKTPKRQWLIVQPLDGQLCPLGEPQRLSRQTVWLSGGKPYYPYAYSITFLFRRLPKKLVEGIRRLGGSYDAYLAMNDPSVALVSAGK